VTAGPPHSYPRVDEVIVKHDLQVGWGGGGGGRFSTVL
jgi:hypothetical protein